MRAKSTATQEEKENILIELQHVIKETGFNGKILVDRYKTNCASGKAGEIKSIGVQSKADSLTTVYGQSTHVEDWRDRIQDCNNLCAYIEELEQKYGVPARELWSLLKMGSDATHGTGFVQCLIDQKTK